MNKNKWFLKFALDSKESKENIKDSGDKIDLMLKKSKPMTPKSKKRLIISVFVAVVVMTIIGVILYTQLRQTEKYFSPNNIITQVDSSKANELTVNYVTDDKPTSLIINTNSSNNVAYFYGDSSHFRLYLSVQGETLPMVFSMSSNNQGYSLSGLPIMSSSLPNGKDSEEYAFFNRLTTNALVPSSPFNWFGLISLLFPLALIILMVVSFSKMSKMQGGGQESIFGMGKSGAKVTKSDVKFSDVAGIKEEKYELSEIVDYLKKPQKYTAMGARVPRGVILYGPPGTGKTLLAKAVAGEADVPFFQMSGSQFEDMLVGVGAKRVRDLFARARKVAPSIIFIDEIDSVASKRGKNEFGGGLADQTINQLLAEMDGFNTTTGIVVMAATNRLDVLDDAILRPGRFDRHIQVSLPDIKEREAILKIHSRNKAISKKVSFLDIARRTAGFSGAQLENVLNEATLLAVREDATIIIEKFIDESIDRVIAGPAKRSKVIEKNERKLIAYHEAGHALVGLYTDNSDVVQKITIIPRGRAAGYTMQTPKVQEINIQKKSDLLDNIRMTLGGRAAEEIVYGEDSITTGAANDLYKITNIVRAMVMQLGMTNVGMTQFAPSEGVGPTQKLYSDAKALEIDDAIEEIIQCEFVKAKKIIKTHLGELDLIVETLLICETIMKNQIDYIHEHQKLPPEAIKLKAKIKKIEAEKKAQKKEAKLEEAVSKNDSLATEIELDEAENEVDETTKAVEEDE